MQMRKINNFSKFLAILLVLLQVLSPLLHTHTSNSALNETHGIHLHNEDFGVSISKVSLDKTPAVTSQAVTLDVIGVPVGNESEKQALPILLLVFLFSSVFLCASLVKSRYFQPEKILLNRLNPRFTSIQPNAPPLK